jgi:hypothetical protein
MKTFAELGTEIGELVERKNAAYGSSFSVAGEFLALCYPDGLQPAQYADALLLVRIFDKQMRIATDRDALGESPYADISGYGILGAHMHQQRKAQEPWQGSASAPDAAKSSETKQPVSAEQPASEMTAPSTSARNGHEPLPQPDGYCEMLTSAPAPSAMEVASPSAGDQQRAVEFLCGHLLTLMRRCNDFQLCAKCGSLINGGALRRSIWGEWFVVCKGCVHVANDWQPRLESLR